MPSMCAELSNSSGLLCHMPATSTVIALMGLIQKNALYFVGCRHAYVALFLDRPLFHPSNPNWMTQRKLLLIASVTCRTDLPRTGLAKQAEEESLKNSRQFLIINLDVIETTPQICRRNVNDFELMASRNHKDLWDGFLFCVLGESNFRENRFKLIKI